MYEPDELNLFLPLMGLLVLLSISMLLIFGWWLLHRFKIINIGEKPFIFEIFKGILFTAMGLFAVLLVVSFARIAIDTIETSF